MKEIGPGQSPNYSSYESSDYDTSNYKDDTKKFRQMVLASTEYGSSEYGGTTSEYGLNLSGWSTEAQSHQTTREMKGDSRGANKQVYAPEPFDVGRLLQAEITFDGGKVTVSTTGPIDPAPGLGSYVEALVRRHDTEFNVVITQINGADQPSQSIHALHVGKMRMKLCKGKTTVAKEYYSSAMQLCGVRGGGNAAVQALFWQVRPDLSFVIAFESERDRNAAIMLARRFAFDCNIMLAGPGDRTPLAS